MSVSGEPRGLSLHRRVGIVGMGYEVPARIRKNEDPIFAWLRENHPEGSALFKGYDERRVLSPGESAVGLGIAAAKKALESAGVDAADIDVVAGFVSVSEHLTPNGLAEIHHDAKKLVRAFHIMGFQYPGHPQIHLHEIIE